MSNDNPLARAPAEELREGLLHARVHHSLVADLVVAEHGAQLLEGAALLRCASSCHRESDFERSRRHSDVPVRLGDRAEDGGACARDGKRQGLAQGATGGVSAPKHPSVLGREEGFKYSSHSFSRSKKKKLCVV
jgi:hypothetical protein